MTRSGKTMLAAALAAATMLGGAATASAVELTFWHHTYPPARAFIEKKAAEFTAAVVKWAEALP